MQFTKQEMDALYARLQQILTSKRYQHSLGVAQTAKELALHYGANPEQAYVAGLVHDYAKNMKKSELIAVAERENLMSDPIEKELPEVLHAVVGAWRLPRETSIQDPAILQAVARHTLGALDMNLLDKILFVADIIEPNRKLPNLEEERKIAFQNLDKAIFRSLEATIRYCLDIGRLLHPASITLRNQYLREFASQEKGK